MKKVRINSEFITLGQFLKFISLITNGCEAKIFLLNNSVLVNHNSENRRGRKLYPDDEIIINQDKYLIIKEH